MAEPRAWHSRGYLPHFDDGVSIQSITYRLADALPALVLAKLEEQTVEDEKRREVIEHYLDAGHGSCLLGDARNAEIVVAAWRHFHGIRYRLHAWVVMPNHVHVLVEPMGMQSIGEMVGAWKSVSARRILRGSATALGRRNGLDATRGGRAPAQPQQWQLDYWDRFIRTEHHYGATVEYLHNNPVKAGLVARAEDWPWSSAAFGKVM